LALAAGSGELALETKPTVDAIAIKSGGGANPVSGQQFGPYKTVRLLGEGGMGVVYLAEQQKPIRRQVALKVIKLGMDTREVIARFESERQALALMDHPNIARVFDAGASEDGRPYFAMEYVPGIPITEYCDQNRLSNRERMQLFITVCQAVQHAHQKGIIHRDIKPSNVLVSSQERPVAKIIDFGVAKATNQSLTQRTLFTEHGLLIGTPEYMSPEQIGAENVDATTDIYSLGTLLFELLVGSLPFDPIMLRRAGYDEMKRIIRDERTPLPTARLRSMGAKTAAIAAQRRTDPQALVRQLRGDLDWITTKAMEKEPSRRYAAVSELAADLERHLRDEPVLASPPGAVYRAKKLVRKHKRAVAGILAAFLCLVVILSWITAVALVNEMQVTLDDVSDRAKLLNSQASLMVSQSINRQPTMPLRTALEDPNLLFLLRSLVTRSRVILEIAVVDAQNNEILVDTLPTRHGIMLPQSDFKRLQDSSWYKQLQILLSAQSPSYQLEESLGRRDKTLLYVRIIILASLIRNDVIVPLNHVIAPLILYVIVAACLTVLLSIFWLWLRN